MLVSMCHLCFDDLHGRWGSRAKRERAVLDFGGEILLISSMPFCLRKVILVLEKGITFL